MGLLPGTLYGETVPFSTVRPFVLIDCQKKTLTHRKCANTLRYVTRRMFLSGNMSEVKSIMSQPFPYTSGKRKFLTTFLKLRPERSPRTARRIIADFSSLFLPYKGRSGNRFLLYAKAESPETEEAMKREIRILLNRLRVSHTFYSEAKFVEKLHGRFPNTIGVARFSEEKRALSIRNFGVLKSSLLKKKKIFGSFSQLNCKYYSRLTGVSGSKNFWLLLPPECEVVRDAGFLYFRSESDCRQWSSKGKSELKAEQSCRPLFVPGDA